MAKQKVVLDEIIINKIYLVRGQKVMLDKDLAELFGVLPTRLRQQVKRNIDRFPNHFILQLTTEEIDDMVSQNVIPSKQVLGGYLPYAFTEHGVLMLSNVLKSKKANTMSIQIIDIFVKMREMLMTHKDILLKIEQLEKQVVKNNGEIQIIFKALKRLIQEPKKPRVPVGFKIGKG